MLSHVCRASLEHLGLFVDPCQRNLWKHMPHFQATLAPQESDDD